MWTSTSEDRVQLLKMSRFQRNDFTVSGMRWVQIIENIFAWLKHIKRVLNVKWMDFVEDIKRWRWRTDYIYQIPIVFILVELFPSVKLQNCYMCRGMWPEPLSSLRWAENERRLWILVWTIPFILVLSQVFWSTFLPFFNRLILQNHSLPNYSCWKVASNFFVCHCKRVFVSELNLKSGGFWKRSEKLNLNPFFYFGSIYWRTHPARRLYIDLFAAGLRNTVVPTSRSSEGTSTSLCIYTIVYKVVFWFLSSHTSDYVLFFWSFFFFFTQFGLWRLYFRERFAKPRYILRFFSQKKKLISAHLPHPWKMSTTWYCEVVRRREEVVICSDALPARSQ